jgi:hypothetical protein
MTFIRTDFKCSKNALLKTAYDVLGSSGFDIESSDDQFENIIVCSNKIFRHKKYRFKVKISTNRDDTLSNLYLNPLQAAVKRLPDT